MLAIVKTIERFHIYLYGLDFTVVTDCNAVVHAINKACLNPRIARWILRLQDYKFKVSHRDGRRMMHVDALSRLVCYTDSIPLEKELQYRQLQDPTLKIIAENLGKKENNKFELIDGLVFRKGSYKHRFVVPDSMISNLIRVYHDDMAHCGFEKTLQGISNKYWFPSFKKRIRNHIDNCITCLIADASSNSREGELQVTNTPTLPFEIWHIDHFGPIKSSADGFKHILVVVDVFSRYTWLSPTKTTDSKEVIKILSTLFNNFCFPASIILHRGTAFTSSEFTTFLRIHNVKHHLVAVAAPWANGMVGRINRILKASLKKVVDEQEFWNIHLSTIQYVLNNTHHTSLKASPSKILLSVEQRNNADVKIIDLIKNICTETESDFQKARDSSRSLAIEATNKIKDYNKIYYDEKHQKPTTYKEGDLVLIKDSSIKPGEDKKLRSNYRGPYYIAKVLDKNRYVKNIPGYNITSKSYNTILSPDRIKLWIKPISAVT